MARLGDTIVYGNQSVTGDVNVTGVIYGIGSGLTNLNASELKSGTVPYDRLPFSSSDVSDWNTAHGWGNHANAGYAQLDGGNWGDDGLGNYGYGGGAGRIYSQNTENSLEGCQFYSSGSTSNTHFSGYGAGIHVDANHAGRAWQLWIPTYSEGGPVQYRRKNGDGEWESVIHIWDNSNLPNPVTESRTISTGDGLSGGGNLSGDRTLSVDSTVVRTSGNQTINGNLQANSLIGSALRLSTAGYNALDLDTARTSGNVGGIRFHSNGTRQGELNFQIGGEIRAQAGGYFNADDLGAGTVDYARLPFSSGNVSNWNTAWDRQITAVSGSGNGTLTLTRPILSNLTTDLSHTHSGHEVTVLGNHLVVGSDGKIAPNSTSDLHAGMYGNYNSTRIGHIWSMGTSYTIASDGSDFGNLYGFAYKHTNNATGGTMGGGHQAVWVANGVPQVSLGQSGVWTNGKFYGDGSSLTNLTGTYSGLRAQATTKADVGLSGIPNTNGSTSNFLRGDGNWATPPNTTYSAGTGLSLSGTRFSFDDSTSNITSESDWAEDSSTAYTSFIGTGSSSVSVGGTSVGNWAVGIRINRNGSGHGGKIIFNSYGMWFGRGSAHEVWHSGNSNSFNSSGTYSGLRAQATTKADVGLSNVPNEDYKDPNNWGGSNGLAGLGYGGTVAASKDDWDDLTNRFERSNNNYPPGLLYAAGISTGGGRLQLAGRYGKASIRDAADSSPWYRIITSESDDQAVGGKLEVGSLQTGSDRTLKDNIRTLEEITQEELDSIEAVMFEWNCGYRKGQTDAGVIAQDVQKVFPSCVSESFDEEGNFTHLTVDYAKLGVLLHLVQRRLDKEKTL